MWNSHTIVVVFKFSFAFACFGKREVITWEKRKTSALAASSRQFSDCAVMCMCLPPWLWEDAFYLPLMYPEFLVKKFTWQFVLYISQISMQLSILTHQISMQLSIFKMCLTKKTNTFWLFAGLKWSALASWYHSTPSGGLLESPRLPCKRSANTFWVYHACYNISALLHCKLLLHLFLMRTPDI